MPEPNTRLFKYLRMYCRAAALAAVGAGCAVLAGWAFHVGLLKSFLPGIVPMKFNTALGLILCGTSLWLILPNEPREGRRNTGRFLALLAALVGGLSFCEDLLGVDLRIDQLFFAEPLGALATSSPGRMAPTTSLSILALGLALLLLGRKTRRGNHSAQVLSLLTLLVVMLAIAGYLYNAPSLYRISMYTQIALNTAVAVFLLSVAIFLARPKTAIAGVLTGEGSGSVMARRFLLVIFIVPLLVGWILLRGQAAELYGIELGLALFATCTVLVFAIVVWSTASKLNLEYEQRSRAEAGLRELNTALEQRVTERTSVLERQTAVLSEQAALLDLAQDAIVVRDMHGEILFWSRGAEAMYGWDSKEALGKNIHQLLRTEFPQPSDAINALVLLQGHWEGEAVHYKRDGTRLIVTSHWALQRDASGAPVQILAINNDITARKRAEANLHSLTDRLSLATDIAKVGVWEWDLAANTLTWDATMFEIYEMPPVVPMPYTNWSSVVHPEDLSVAESALQKVIEEKGEGSAEYRILRKDDSVRIISAVARAILDERGNVSRLIGVNLDVTERKRAERALRDSEESMTHSAEHDFLTGLPNRMLLNDRIEQAIAQAPRHKQHVAVLFLDLDGFKHINDSLGHPTGDTLLQSVAKRLVDCVRSSDTVSRQGGDEFVVLLSEVAHAEDAAISARRMLHAVAEPHSIDRHVLHITTSIGVSVYPDDGLDAETLIKNADTAMYQAKEHGRQSYRFFKPAMNVRAVERQSFEEDLRRALERPDFALHYQPKIDLRSGAITGAEALIRWTHPTRGLVPPAQFIPVAEDCGLMRPVGDWVLREACKQARTWIDAGLPMASMAVNVSAMQLLHETFLETVFEILRQTRLEPGCLEVELTESVLMKHTQSTASILRTLRETGVKIAVDDFGTGYSSLSYLRIFPVDALKIDQSFIRQIGTGGEDVAIVTAVIGMARSLKLRVIAEGVETQKELAFLQAQQCDEAQGYYFSRPVGPEQFAKLLQYGCPPFATYAAPAPRSIRPSSARK